MEPVKVHLKRFGLLKTNSDNTCFEFRVDLTRRECPNCYTKMNPRNIIICKFVKEDCPYHLREKCTECPYVLYMFVFGGVPLEFQLVSGPPIEIRMEFKDAILLPLTPRTTPVGEGSSSRDVATQTRELELEDQFEGGMRLRRSPRFHHTG